MIKTNVFEIAGLQLKIEFEDYNRMLRSYEGRNCEISPNVFGAYEAFEEKEQADCQLYYHSIKPWKERLCQKYLGCIGYIDSGDYFELVYYTHEESLLLNKLTSTHPLYSIVIKKDFTEAHYIPYQEEYEKYDLFWVNEVFRGLILLKNGITFHGSAIEKDHSGTIFIGVSGAGKSTQAHLWQRYRQAIILNGDCPVVTIENEAYVHGTPWCGSSGESINRKTKLRNIVIVQKDADNRVEKLPTQDALLAMFQYVIKPEFDLVSLDMTLQFLEELVKRVNVYKLYCTKTEDAVRALEMVEKQNG